MFEYLVKNGRNAECAVDEKNAAVLKIGPYEFEGMKIPARSIDMTRYLAQKGRLYLLIDGPYSTAPRAQVTALYRG